MTWKMDARVKPGHDAEVFRHPEVRANGSGPKWPARWQAPRASKDARPKRQPKSGLPISEC